MSGCRGVFAVLACGLIAWTAALAGQFVYDDIHSVQANPAIRSLANVPSFFYDVEAFSSTKGHMYRPVLLTTYAVNHALGGLEPAVFKATNVLLHLLCSVLLLSVLRRLVVGSGAAVLAACLFAAHPLASEAVNLVSGRSELLLVLGLLLGVRGHQAWLEGRSWGMPITVLAAIVACGSKETGVVLPVLLLVIEWLHRSPAVPTGTWLRGAALRVLPAVAVTVVYLLVRRELLGAATVHLAQLAGTGDVMSGHGRDVITQWATMCTLLPRTLLQAVVPLGLSLEPPVTFHRSFLDAQVIAGAVALLAVTVLGLRAGRQRPAVVFGTCLAWGSSLPWILLPLNVILSEHRLYGLLAGLAAVVAGVLPDRVVAVRARPWLQRLAAAGLLLAYSGVAAARSLDYRDERVLWREVIAVQPHCFRAHWGLGLTLMRHGELRASLKHLAMAHRVYPGHKSALVGYLEAMLAEPDPSEQQPFLALVLADDLLERAPLDPYYRILKASALIQAGVATGAAGAFAEAEQVALSCLEIAVPKGLVFRVAARARHSSGDLEGAIELLDESVRRGLDHHSVLIDRASLLREAGRLAEAEADLRAALAQDPMDPRVHAALQSFYGAGAGR